MSKLPRRLAAPLIALTISAGLFTHVEAASAATIVQISNCDRRLEQFQNSGARPAGRLHRAPGFIRYGSFPGRSWTRFAPLERATRH